MKISIILVVAFLLGCAFSAYQDPSETFEKEDGVIVLTADNFDYVVKREPFMVVEFYAPWCGHCKKLAPEYAAAAEVLANNDPPLTLAKLDTTEAKEIGTKYGVKGYPTLKVFRGDSDPASVADYSGPREKQGIIDYVLKISGPATAEVTAADVAAFTAKSPAILGVFPEGAESEAFLTYAANAQKMRDDFEFGHIFEANDACTGICMYKDYDDKFLTFDGEDFSSWATKNSVPSVAVMDRDPKNRKWLSKTFESESPKLIFIADFESKSPESNAIREELQTVAKATTIDLSFVQADAGANAGMLTYFGLNADQVPTIVIHAPKDKNGDSKYIKFNPKVGELAQFVQDWSEGKVERHIKSEEAPVPNDEPVRVVVAHTLVSEVIEAKKDVMIEFYAPWCGHCKKLTPIYEEVAKHYASDPNVVIAKMDSTANDILVKDMEVKGFPTIFFVQADGTIKGYSGVRDKDSLIEYIDAKRVSVASSGTEEAAADSVNEDKEEL